MKYATLAALLTVLVAAGIHAQEAGRQEKRETIAFEFEIDGESGDQASRIHWVGEDLDLADLQPGESRTVTGESGKVITVTRGDDGLQFDIDGETVVVPDIGHHGSQVTLVDAGGDRDIDVDIHAGVAIADDVTTVSSQAIRAMPIEGVTIISGVPLDDSVRESIRSVLISAGIDEAVRFVDHADADESVSVMTRRIEVIR
jgi:hypothetical protein